MRIFLTLLGLSEEIDNKNIRMIIFYRILLEFMNRFGISILMEATKNCLEPSDPTGKKYHGTIRYENRFAPIYHKNRISAYQPRETLVGGGAGKPHRTIRIIVGN